jgi:hypothetical protein
MTPNTLAGLEKLHDKLFKKSATLRQRIAALKAAQRKLKRAKK